METRKLVVRITAIHKEDAYYENERRHLLNKHVIINLGERNANSNCWQSKYEEGYYTGNAYPKKPLELECGSQINSLFFLAFKFAIIKEITE